MKKSSMEDIEKNPSLYYKCKNGSYFPYLKQDIYKAIDINNPSTVIPFLKELDFPFVLSLWKNYAEKYPNQNILGRYLNRLNLGNLKAFTFKDSEYLNKINTIL